MYALFAIGLFGFFAYRTFLSEPKESIISPTSLTGRLDKLWDIVHESITERKYLRAERALLTILKVDERNAMAYNRLGILYAKQKEFSDAIECFEIAQSLEPSASSLHNVGLIYYETGNYHKAAIAFEQALDMENSIPSRYIAYGKVQEKLGDMKKMTDAYEKAVELEPSPQMLQFVASAYARTNQYELAEKTQAVLAQMNTATTAHASIQPHDTRTNKRQTARSPRPPRRIIM